jgi:2'-5' RNA ligase
VGVPPHITLLYPWRDPVAEADLEQVSAITHRYQSFDVEFTTVRRFDTGVVHLHPEPQTGLNQLMAELVESFPDTPPYGGSIDHPIPHLTVGKAPPGDELDRLHATVVEALSSMLPVAVRVEAISVMEKQIDSTWQTVADLPLGKMP